MKIVLARNRSPIHMNQKNSKHISEAPNVKKGYLNHGSVYGIMDKMESEITLDRVRRNIVIYSLYALYCRFRYSFSHIHG